MNEKELMEKGKQVTMGFALAGKKQGLEDTLKAEYGKIGDNNAEVALIQEKVDVANALSQNKIESLTKELDEVSKELETLLDVLRKEGYALPIGGKKSKNIAL